MDMWMTFGGALNCPVDWSPKNPCLMDMIILELEMSHFAVEALHT